MGKQTAFDSIFREYDIRGRVNDAELCERNVYRAVSAYARYLRKRGISRAVVGYDNRKCSSGFADAAIKALTGAGIDVIYIGLCVTPTVYYAQYLYKCEGACMITASHNPDGWSGFKLAKGYSQTLEPEDIQEVHGYAINLTPEDEVGFSGALGSLTVADAWESYIDAIVSRIHMGSRRPRLVLDAGNGGAGLFAYEIFQRLGCVTFQLNCDPDMNYPHYFPNPSDIAAREKLKELVTHPYIRADMGLSFDGDGDRLGVVDEEGGDIYSDIILALLAKQLLEKRPGEAVVFDVKCSQTVRDVIEQNGGAAVMCKTGHSYIKAALQKHGAALAGERSGHIFFGGEDYFGFDDALFAAAKLVEYVSHTADSVSDITRRLPRYITSPEIKAHCADDLKYAVTEAIVQELKAEFPGRVNDTNGARVQFDRGWGLVRASSNLPELVLIFEADSSEHMKEVREVFRRIVGGHAEVSTQWENDLEASYA